MKIQKYLKNVKIYRKWMRYYGIKIGLSSWQCFIHDLSDYNLFKSINYYNHDISVGIIKLNNDCHKNNNPHHYEYWKKEEMPYKYVIELLCDYLASSRTYIGEKFTYQKGLRWWNQIRKNQNISIRIKWFITHVFEQLERLEMEASIENQLFDDDDIILCPAVLKTIWNQAAVTEKSGKDFCDD